MALRVGINGAGRIGRGLLRLLAEPGPVEVVAVNDVAAAESVAHLLRHDSVYGAFPGQVRAGEELLEINGRRLRFSRKAHPAEIDWRGVDVVVEATGHFVEAALAGQHRAPRVLVSAVSPGADKTVVLGLTEPGVTTERVVSGASCTTHAAALPLGLLHRWYGVAAAEMTTVHCTTGSQVTIDKPHADPRRARAALLSIIPTSTTASVGLGLVLPELLGRLTCLAVRVPTAAVSLVLLVVQTERPLEPLPVLRDKLRAEAAGPLAGLFGVTDEPLVSTDFKGDPRSSIVDAELLERPGSHLLRLVAWYDNEWGYANRLAELLGLWAQ